MRLRGAAAAGGVPVRVWWNKRIWSCCDGGCEARTWAEESGLAGWRRVPGGGAVGRAVAALGAAGASAGGLGRRLGVGWHTVWSAVL